MKGINEFLFVKILVFDKQFVWIVKFRFVFGFLKRNIYSFKYLLRK